MTRYLITLLLALASVTVLCACGGGSDEPIDEVVTVNLLAWEVQPNVCSFSSELAYAQAIDLGAVCDAVLIDNTVDGEVSPSKVWG